VETPALLDRLKKGGVVVVKSGRRAASIKLEGRKGKRKKKESGPGRGDEDERSKRETGN
jgi:hypothetical protein